MQVGLLGEFQVIRAGLSRPLGGTKQRAVLAMLALASGQVVSTAALIDGLWDSPPPGATNTLQAYISRLRKVLTDDSGAERFIVRRPSGYQLTIATTAVDAGLFSEFLAQGLAALPDEPERSASLLRRALALWRGPALPEFTDEPFSRTEIPRLDQLRTRALEAAIDAELALGRHSAVIAELESLAAKYPLDEAFAARLMTALYRSGRQVQALEVFGRIRTRLADELGLYPSRMLQDLQSAMLSQDPVLDGPSAPAITSRQPDPDVAPGSAERGALRTFPDIWNVAPRHPRFTGRTDLLASMSRVLANRDTVVVTSLYGLGGVGKSQLAIEFAHQHAADYDVVWWIDAEQPLLVPAQLATLAERLLPRAWTGVDAAVAALLAELNHRGRWLLIFDNAARPADLAGYRPAGSGHVLVTSRYPGWGEMGERIEVDVLPRADTVSLLRSRLPQISGSDAAAMAMELGDLPLAVMQAAAYLEHSGESAAEYLDRFARQRFALLARGEVVDYQGRVDTAWLLSLDRLRAENPAAVELLTAAALLAPEQIPIDLFGAHPDLLGGELGRQALTDPEAVADALAAAVRYSLVRRQAGTFQVHRLVQAVIAHRAGPARRPAEQLVATLLGAADPGDPNDPDTWARYRMLTPHLLHVGAAGDHDARFRHVLLTVVAYTNVSGDPRASRRIAEQVYGRWSTALGPNHGDVLTAAAALTSSLTWLGAHEQARALAQDTLSRARRVLGPDHPTTLRLATNLTFALAWLGDVESACAIGMDSLDRSRTVVGADHPDTLRLAANLTLALVWNGQAEAAQDLGYDTLARSRLALGEENPITLVTQAHLALAHAWAGDEEADRTLGEQTFERARRALGPTTPPPWPRPPTWLSCCCGAARWTRPRQWLTTPTDERAWSSGPIT